MNNDAFIDAPLPPAMAIRAEELAVKKVGLPISKIFALAVLAGAFMAVGAIFATTVTAGGVAVHGADGSVMVTSDLPFGVSRLLSGLVFSLGLILVVVSGAELFTGNNLIVMAFSNGKITLGQLLSNWMFVYLGNFVGAIATAGLMFLTAQYKFGDGVTGLNILVIGEVKTALNFWQAVVLGMMGNSLVCLAIWMVYSARTTTDKIMAIVPPTTAFIAAGFEHSIANMYFIPIAMLVKQWGSPAFYHQIGVTPLDFPHLTWTNFVINNLLPVTIGNIIGGAVMVGLVYWFVYLRKS
jgi:formate transporter